MRFHYRLHALERMFERMIDPEEVEKAVLEGETIEEYPEDKPYSSFFSTEPIPIGEGTFARSLCEGGGWVRDYYSVSSRSRALGEGFS